MAEAKDVIIIGSGPAGLTAAIYIGRGGYDPFVIGGFEFGGQLMTSLEVENYPGFVETLEGPDLMDSMRKQAEKFEAEILEEDVSEVDFKTSPFKVVVGDEEFRAKAVIIATGASPKWLGLESEQRLRGRGVSACATCDGFFFKDQKMMVVGGGDTAMEEALFLSKLAEMVTVIHRRDRLRAEKIMQDRAFANEKILFLWDSVVDEVL
ncbi:MAG: FAD-dependent oxidoreductase, partial [Candidatus Geothermarchaeales archaeon]